MSLDKIIITVPHSKCISNVRVCDLRAEKAANMFKEEIDKKIDVDIYKNDIFRFKMDGNRSESRVSNFRNKIRESMKNSKQKYNNVFLLDIHSFPNRIESFGTNPNVPKIVFISKEKYHRFLRSFIYDFYSEKEAENLGVIYAYTTDDNDILLEAEEYGIDAILIEFNEDEDYFNLDEQKDFIQKFSLFMKNKIKNGVKNEIGNGIGNGIKNIPFFIIISLIIVLIILYFGLITFNLININNIG